MTKEELIQQIEAYVRNSAVDSYTNLRLQSILLALTKGSIVSTMETSAEFDEAIADNPTTPIMAYLADDPTYTGASDVVLWRIPGRGIGQLAIDFITDERN